MLHKAIPSMLEHVVIKTTPKDTPRDKVGNDTDRSMYSNGSVSVKFANGELQLKKIKEMENWNDETV